MKFCTKCGNELVDDAVVCTKCGCAVTPSAAPAGAAPAGAAPAEANLNGQDKVTVALLCFFFGAFGVHNFVMGESKKGIMKIVFTILCGIGSILALIDFIKILCGTYVAQPG